MNGNVWENPGKRMEKETVRKEARWKRKLRDEPGEEKEGKEEEREGGG